MRVGQGKVGVCGKYVFSTNLSGGGGECQQCPVVMYDNYGTVLNFLICG